MHQSETILAVLHVRLLFLSKFYFFCHKSTDVEGIIESEVFAYREW